MELSSRGSARLDTLPVIPVDELLRILGET
jgi:uncharacterized protein with GYD domain